MDLSIQSRLRGGMDDAEDLIDSLLTAAGMIMEDYADEAIVKRSDLAADERAARIASAGKNISVLARAAAIVADLWIPK